MVRAYLAIFVWAIMLVVLGIPVFLAGLVYPSHRLIAWSSALWARVMLGICGLRLTIEGARHVRDGVPKFYLANHQSTLDIPIVVAALDGDVRLMSKRELFRIPVFGLIMRRYGYVAIDKQRPRVALAKLDRMLEQVRRKPVSLAVFPEGTRSVDGRLLPFRKGTMKICKRAGFPVVPVTIDGSYRVGPRGQLRAHPGPVRLTFAAPIPAEEVAAMSPIELHDRVRQTMARELGQSADRAAEDQEPERAEGTRVEPRSDIRAAAHS